MYYNYNKEVPHVITYVLYSHCPKEALGLYRTWPIWANRRVQLNLNTFLKYGEQHEDTHAHCNAADLKNVEQYSFHFTAHRIHGWHLKQSHKNKCYIINSKNWLDINYRSGQVSATQVPLQDRVKRFCRPKILFLYYIYYLQIARMLSGMVRYYTRIPIKINHPLRLGLYTLYYNYCKECLPTMSARAM